MNDLNNNNNTNVSNNTDANNSVNFSVPQTNNVNNNPGVAPAVAPQPTPNVNQVPPTPINEPTPEEVLSQTVTIETINPVDRKAAKKLEKEQARKAKKEAKLKKKNQPTAEEIISSNAAENNKPVNIVESAVIYGASGSQVIGNVSGETITPTNIAMPAPIDITVKQKVDPKDNTKKIKVVTKKEKILSIFVSVFGVVVICLAIFCAYYFGFKTNPALFSVKNITIELGDELPSSVSYYINSKNKTDDMEFTLDLSRVSKNVAGTYTYSVTRKNTTKSGQITIKDTKPPVLVLKENLVFSRDAKITKEDLVESCSDISNCNYTLQYEINTETAGEKEAKLTVKDDVGNETTVTAKITIIDISKTLTCTSDKTPSSDETYYTVIVDTLKFDSNDRLVQATGLRKYVYEDYFAFSKKVKDIKSDEQYIIDDENSTYSIENKPDTNNLSEFKDLTKYYVEKGYSCK